MAIQIKDSHSYYVTESIIALPAEPGEVDILARSLRASGKMVVQYNMGGIQWISIEQRTKISSDTADDQIREILGIGSRKFNGDEKKA